MIRHKWNTSFAITIFSANADFVKMFPTAFREKIFRIIKNRKIAEKERVCYLTEISGLWYVTSR